ncbi:hypothetical protein [Pseudodesulfovibrio pelocollis]|uniref:hypothetical protein n=1 Tax=Pseudodesulfovibrio pelocollis TaxID=3051432 RepID=UPI00255A94D0|nr:hypothetical protein [Pseudodesulfovibrio sp. SB368]
MDKTKPHLDEDGTLVIPFECADHGYKYWKQEGRPLADILTELGVDEATWAAYTNLAHPASGGLVKAVAFDEEPDEQGVESDSDADVEPLSPSEADLAHPAPMA